MKTKFKFQKIPQGILSVVASLALCVMASGCSSVDRYRALDNPNVSASTLALQVCSNCHGAHGISVSPNFPNLAGQMPQYFEVQMKSFRTHSRSDSAAIDYMWGISARLTDEQISGLATYFSSQKPAPEKLQGSTLEPVMN